MSDKSEESVNLDQLPFIIGKEATEEDIKEAETKFSNLMKVITEDARQLSEYLVAEENAVEEMCKFLEKILSELNLSVIIPEKAVPMLEKSKEIILNSECHLIVVREDGAVESKSLNKYPPETILTIIWALIPKLREEISAYLRKVSVRLNFLEIVKEELKSIQKPFVRNQESTIEEFREDKAKEIFVPQ